VSSFAPARQRRRRRPELHGEATAARSSGSSGAGCSGGPPPRHPPPLHRKAVAGPRHQGRVVGPAPATGGSRSLQIRRNRGPTAFSREVSRCPLRGAFPAKYNAAGMECLPSPSAGGLSRSY
jgi:hypothetical protein